MKVQIAVSGQAEEARRAAEAARSAMARLMAVAGHDLRQPVQVAMLSIARAVSEGVSAPAARRLTLALEAMKRLGKELDDIARLSQRDEGLQPHRRPVYLDDVLSEVDRDWRDYAEACGTALDIQSAGALVDTDPTMLKTILRNLVGNAIRHSGPRGRVVVSCRRRADTLVIDVEDDGEGIPVAYLARIFDAFERGRSAQAGDGLGLGLTIVRQTAEMLNHPILVRSVEQQGSTFSVVLPLLGSNLPRVVDLRTVRSC